MDLRPPRASPRPQGSLLLRVGAKRWLLTPQLCRGCEAKAGEGARALCWGAVGEPYAGEGEPCAREGARALCWGGSMSPVLGGEREPCAGEAPGLLCFLCFSCSKAWSSSRRPWCVLGSGRRWGGGGLWAPAPGAHL